MHREYLKLIYITRRKPTFPQVPRLRKCAGHFRTYEGFCTVYRAKYYPEFSPILYVQNPNPETFPKAWNSRKCRFSSSMILTDVCISDYGLYYRNFPFIGKARHWTSKTFNKQVVVLSFNRIVNTWHKHINFAPLSILFPGAVSP